ncbi:MAG: hypothetical protein ACR2M1_02770, partial [Gemmatimonadaceae bacterium]
MPSSAGVLDRPVLPVALGVVPHGGSGRSAWLPTVTALLIVAAALCGPAIYNGYPLVFSDTAAYVSSLFTGDVPI